MNTYELYFDKSQLSFLPLIVIFQYIERYNNNENKHYFFSSDFNYSIQMPRFIVTLSYRKKWDAFCFV